MALALQALWFAAVRIVVTALIGLALGWLIGPLWAGVALALGAYLGLQLVNLFRVDGWLRHRGFAEAPDIGGAWGDAITQVVRLHRRKRFHKQRFVQTVRGSGYRFSARTI